MISDSSVRLPSTGKPSHNMTGVDRPGGGVRLYASRDLPGVSWGMRDVKDGGIAWHIDADMQNVLVIDAPTWGEAYARAFEIWENQDRDRELPPERGYVTRPRMTGKQEAERRAHGHVLLPGQVVKPAVTNAHDAMIERDMYEHGFSGETP
jgi:hypothetical protein